jgi:hypothetical protein
MFFFKYVNLPVFLVSLAIGMFAVYLYAPDKRKIYVYPTPENVDILLYRDRTGGCFKFDEQEVPCPADESKIAQIPVQS